jgi:hypothetical protein
MNPSEPKLVVNTSAVPDATGSTVRDLVVVLAAFPILLKLIGARDASAILAWLQSSEGATFLAIVVPIAVSGWRAFLAMRRKAKLVDAAKAYPDEVKLVGPNPPPAVDQYPL